MDETQQSCKSDAAATRKRRSSILKSQRPPRTPFSELEFNVATPPDNTKSRRVSFSRRTGVAEFVTNEATTTWKNFYEEQNKALENSGNDSGGNVPLGPIGKRIFDQQFEEVEAVDFRGSLNPGFNISTSFNNINFNECTEDIKLPGPQYNFELSAVTNTQTRVFGDDLAISCGGEVSATLDVNFSNLNPIVDDLDEIQRDIQMQGKALCHNPFQDRQTFSNYIEVDLNCTHVEFNNDESDMSITDTIHSPKVQDISKSISIEKKIGKDWTIDKENIAINPYASPIETDNFAVQDESDKVLIFDGKRLTVQSEIPDTRDYQRKTIILNTNDDLPNPQSNLSTHLSTSNLKNHTISNNDTTIAKEKTIYNDDVDISLTIPVTTNVTEKRRTIVFEKETGDISITQALPTNIMNKEKRRTVLFDNESGNISVTETIAPNILAEKRKSVVYDDEDYNISITQAVPTNIIANKRKTIVYDEDNCDISMTQPIPANIISEKRKTIVYDEDDCNISITQAIPSNIITAKRKTIVYDEDDCNISMTQAIPSNIITDKRKTTVYHEDDCDISVTQALPVNIIQDKRKTIVYDEGGNISMTQALPASIIIDKKESFVFENDDVNISMAQSQSASNAVLKDKRKTIVYENEECNISMTQALPANIIAELRKTISNDINLPTELETTNNCITKMADKRRTIVYEENTGNISVTQVLPTNIIVTDQNAKSDSTESRRTGVFENDTGNLSVIHTVPTSIITTDPANHTVNDNEKRRTIVFENDSGNISITQAIPTNLLVTNDISTVKTTKSDSFLGGNIDLGLDDKNLNMFRTNSDYNRRGTVVFDEEEGDISMTQVLPANLIKSIVMNSELYENSINAKSLVNDNVDPEACQAEDNIEQRDVINGTKENRLTLYDGNISMTKSVTIISDEKKNSENIIVNMTEIVHDKNTTKTSNNKNKEEKLNTDLEKLLDVSMTDVEPERKNKTLIKDTDLFLPVDELHNQMNISKPIPCDLSKIQDLQESFKQFDDRNVSQVLVYQMTSQKQDARFKNDSISIENSALDLNRSAERIDKDADELPETVANESIDAKVSELETLEQDTATQHVVSSQESVDKQSINTKPSESINRQISENQSLDIKTPDNENIDQNSLETASLDQEQPQIEEIHHKLVESKSFHSIAQESINQMSEKSSETQTNEQKSPLPNIIQKSSVLSNLLDMSMSSLKDDDQNTELPAIELKEQLEEKSNDALFYITDSNEDVVKEDKNELQITNKSPLPLEYKAEKKRSPILTEFQKKLNLLKTVYGEDKIKKINKQNKKYSHDVSIEEKSKLKASKKSFKTANDTTELLEMLSDLTEKRRSRINSNKEEDTKAQKSEDLLLEDTEPKKLNKSLIDKKPKGFLPIENKNTVDSKKPSLLPKRQSVGFSREEMLSNISMAAATLQKSRFELDESDLLEDTISPEKLPKRKSVIHNNEVVKTLQFDEEEIIEDKKDNVSLLRKTAFGECSYMDNEKKAFVIPSFLKDVTEGVKELMTDLVKPMADHMPFEAGNLDRSRKKNVSTCSNQTQVNLIGSSQIDVSVELYSNPTSVSDIKKIKSVDIITDAVHRSLNRALTTPIGETVTTELYLPKSEENKLPKYESDTVLVFDHENPLNNILLAPPAPLEGHKYNPDHSIEDKKSEQINQMNETQKLAQVNTAWIPFPPLKEDIEANESNGSSNSNVSKSSVDQSTYTKAYNKDKEVNTVIAMKGTKELLEVSSSLTLVDEVVNKPNNIDIKPSDISLDCVESPVKVIYECEGTEKDSDRTSTEEVEDKDVKSNKRSYSATKQDKHQHCTLSSLSITPKPASKIQKIDSTPEKPDNVIVVEHAYPKMDIEIDKSPEKRGKKSLNFTVQAVVAEYDIHKGKKNVEAKFPDKSSVVSDEQSNTESICDMEDKCSFTSSKDLKERVISRTSQVSEMDWQMEDKKCLSNCESSVNIVSKIDMLPFMGCADCEWHSSTVDSWSFRLLHGRLLLTTRLARHHDNSTTCVRADTPVLNVMLETLHEEKHNSVASLCIRFAAEAVRYELSRGNNAARDIPALLRRCAAVSRLAARWARAMHDARARLAYNLNDDGLLTLKVANVSLRCVWEVVLRVDMVVTSAGSAPWPRASVLRQASVLPRASTASQPSLARILAGVNKDWGHAPKTVWRIFRYLKNKRREDDILGI